jgi:hypothetical protein
MDDAVRRLIQETERHRRLMEQTLGPSESLSRQIEKLRISERHLLGPAESLARRMEKLRISNEHLLGPAESLARQMEKLRISETALGLPTTMAAAIEKGRTFQGLPRVDRQWEIVAERARELATFGAIERSVMAEAMERSRRSVIDEPTRKIWEQAAMSLPARFRLPELSELRNVDQRMKEALARSASMQPNLDAIHRSLAAFEGIKTPWIDRLDVSRSFDSLAGLVGLGTAARFAPYAPVTIATVNSPCLNPLFCDWR